MDSIKKIKNLISTYPLTFGFALGAVGWFIGGNLQKSLAVAVI